MSEQSTAIPERDVESIVHALCANPPGYIIDEEGTPWPPHDPHGANGHRYDMRCAICRAGDRPEALRELVQAVLGSDLAALADENEALRQEVRKFQQWVSAAINDSDPEADCEWLCAKVCAGPCEGFPVGPIKSGSDGGG